MTKRDNAERAADRVAELKLAAEYAQPRIYWSKSQGRFVARSQDIAVCTGHGHFGIVNAIRTVESTRPDLKGEFVWRTYIGKSGREWPCVVLSREGVAAVFDHIRPVEACRNPRLVMYKYFKLFDEREAERTNGTVPHRLREALATALSATQPPIEHAEPAEPAPDSAITPPDAEPFGLFDSAHAITDPAESWEINAAVVLLTKRAGVPLYIAQDLFRWNKQRCDALTEDLYRQGSTWDHLDEIWASTPPKRRKTSE